MKHNLRAMSVVCTLLTLILVVSGCAFNPAGLMNQKRMVHLQGSRAAWINAKEAHQGTYEYTSSFESWTGYRANTTLVVRDDEVSERYFEATYRNESGEMVNEEWVEQTKEELGSHRDGAPAKTIDELYDICAETVLTQSPLGATIWLEFFEDGILHRCTYQENNCADDCSTGVHIDTLTFTDQGQ